MSPALWGTATAFGWGTADFIARFSGRALGHASALLGMLLVGALALTAWTLASGALLVWDWSGAWLLAATGVGVMVATLLLYQGLARGPVTIVAPIVGSYPALVVALAVIFGARPNALQWAAMAAVMAGVVVVARSAAAFGDQGEATEDQSEATEDQSEATEGQGEATESKSATTGPELRKTIFIALASAVGFALAISAGQAATPIYGELQTVWIARLVSLAALLPLFLLPRYELSLPVRWWPILAAQGLLDSGAYLALFAGSHGAGAEIAAVTASGFGAVTVILARVFLREAMSGPQWGGIALIFAGVAVLAGSG